MIHQYDLLLFTFTLSLLMLFLLDCVLQSLSFSHSASYPHSHLYCLIPTPIYKSSPSIPRLRRPVVGPSPSAPSRRFGPQRLEIFKCRGQRQFGSTSRNANQPQPQPIPGPDQARPGHTVTRQGHRGTRPRWALGSTQRLGSLTWLPGRALRARRVL